MTMHDISTAHSPMEISLIAPCGMNCAVCSAHLRQNNPCHGCRDAEQNKPKTRVQCRLRVCQERTGDYCCDCREFPCEPLEHIDRRYRTKYGMSEIENLVYIRDHGIDKFLKRERKRWVSKEGILCVHDRKRYPLAAAKPARWSAVEGRAGLSARKDRG